MTALNEAEIFIKNMEQKCAPREKELCGLYWKLATTGEESVAKTLAEKEKELKMIFSDKEECAALKKWKTANIEDPLTARQVTLLLNDYLPNQLDEATIKDLVVRSTEIENIYNVFRAELDGKKLTNNDIKEILKKEKDNEKRRKAWEATKQIGTQVADKVVEIAKRRNKAARSLGFENHFEMAMELQELDSGWVLKTFQDLKEKSQKIFEKQIDSLHTKLASYYNLSSKEEVMPWHYDDPFAQQAPTQVTVDLDPYLKDKDILKICREFYAGMDLDIADVLERSDLFEKTGKSQHAFCITMDKGQDVRVLANIRPNSYWASTMLHELGHAAYSKNIDPKLPHFLRDEAHIFATEAIAMLMERMMHHPEWLQKMLGMKKSETDKIEVNLREAMRLDKLIIARWIMLVTRFEKALYTDPDQDLNSLWWNLVKEYQLLQKPSGRNHPDWAAKIHIASHPVYYQNYLLGELMAAQIAETLEKESVGKPLTQASFCGVSSIGKLLKEKMFSRGCQWPWTKLVPHVTGQELSINSFVNQFC